MFHYSTCILYLVSLSVCLFEFSCVFFLFFFFRFLRFGFFVFLLLFSSPSFFSILLYDLILIFLVHFKRKSPKRDVVPENEGMCSLALSHFLFFSLFIILHELSSWLSSMLPLHPLSSEL